MAFGEMYFCLREEAKQLVSLKIDRFFLFLKVFSSFRLFSKIKNFTVWHHH